MDRTAMMTETKERGWGKKKPKQKEGKNVKKNEREKERTKRYAEETSHFPSCFASPYNPRDI
jgi:hypothetical protein